MRIAWCKKPWDGPQAFVRETKPVQGIAFLMGRASHQHSPSTPHSATDKHLYPELRMIQFERAVIRGRSLRAD